MDAPVLRRSAVADAQPLPRYILCEARATHASGGHELGRWRPAQIAPDVPGKKTSCSRCNKSVEVYRRARSLLNKIAELVGDAFVWGRAEGIRLVRAEMEMEKVL